MERQQGLTTRRGGNCQVYLISSAPRVCLGHSQPLNLENELGPSPFEAWGSDAQGSALSLGVS